jgi:hypothetical protein
VQLLEERVPSANCCCTQRAAETRASYWLFQSSYKAMTEVTNAKSSSPGAIRMERSRDRRRRHLRCVTIQVRDREIAAFIRSGYLLRERREDPKAIAHAVHQLLDFVAEQEQW